MTKKTKRDITKGSAEKERNRDQGKEEEKYIPLFKQFSKEYRIGNKN